ncbi:MAG: alginate lyase family protein [Nitrospinaceae bacterium]
MIQETQEILKTYTDPSETDGLIFRPPYNRFSPAELLRYFGAREGISCFSVPDPEETGPEKIEAILENRFEFNNECYSLARPMDWRHNPSEDIEWHILLHKFYYAVGLGMAFNETGHPKYLKKWVELTASWIDQEISPGFIASDVTGRRIQSWVYAYYHFVMMGKGDGLSPEFHIKFLTSLHRQTLYLIGHLAPGRNHRTLELYSIFLVAVVFPEFERSREWLRFSLDAIVHNMQTDLLEDGVQSELSTDYHHIVLKNYLCARRLAAMNGIVLPPVMDGLLVKALEFALHAHKPDGTIPSLSDGDTGCFLTLLEQGAELYDRDDFRYVATRGKQGHPPRDRSRAFPQSGYYILRSGWAQGKDRYEDERYLIFDCGPLGAGNHGHLDLLSFELAAYGRSLVVDPGRYTYSEAGEVNWRVLFRGTGYHNTVQVDQMNQTRYIKLPKKYKIKGPSPDYELKTFVTETGFDLLHGVAKSHEYEATHERKIYFVRGEYWILFDHLLGGETHVYDQLFHLSPEAFRKVEMHEREGALLICSPNLIITKPFDPAITTHVENGYVSYKYGEKHPAPVLRFSQRAKSAAFANVLYPFKKQAPTIDVKRIPVFAEDGSEAGPIAQALSVTIDHSGEKMTDILFSGPAESSCFWRLGECHIKGSYLLSRMDSTGGILDMHSSPGAKIEGTLNFQTVGVEP